MLKTIYSRKIYKYDIIHVEAIFIYEKTVLSVQYSQANCKPAAYLSSHNQHKYCQLAEKYKLSVKFKLLFGIVGSALAV